MPPPGSKSPSEVLRDPETKNGQLYRELLYLTVRIYCRLVSSFIKKIVNEGLISYGACAQSQCGNLQ